MDAGDRGTAPGLENPKPPSSFSDVMGANQTPRNFKRVGEQLTKTKFGITFRSGDKRNHFEAVDTPEPSTSGDHFAVQNHGSEEGHERCPNSFYCNEYIRR